jgi:hypothetical protein
MVDTEGQRKHKLGMEIYDINVLNVGMNPIIDSVKDCEAIHDTMVGWDFKVMIGDLNAMPHYRGEQKFGWDLATNLFRTKSLQGDNAKAIQAVKNGAAEFERVIISNFGNNALRTLFDNEKHGKDWDLLFQAQHASIKTCLLDWSPNVYAPLFFATEESKDADIEKSDAQFWVYMVPFDKIRSHNTFPVKDSFYEQDPYAIKEGAMINVSVLLDDLSQRAYETRIFHQKGRFYISSKDSIDIAMNKQPEVVHFLYRFTVPGECKASIRDELEKRGMVIYWSV